MFFDAHFMRENIYHEVRNVEGRSNIIFMLHVYKRRELMFVQFLRHHVNHTLNCVTTEID